MASVVSDSSHYTDVNFSRRFGLIYLFAMKKRGGMSGPTAETDSRLVKRLYQQDKQEQQSGEASSIFV